MRPATVWKVSPTKGLNMNTTDASSGNGQSSTLAVTLSTSCVRNRGRARSILRLAHSMSSS